MRSELNLHADGGAAESDLGVPQLMTISPSPRSFFPEQIRVGRYDLIYRIGSGGMAAVFVGRLSGLAGFERMVAVKIIHQHLADSKKFVNMFLDEARMAASIHHPNVVEIYEVGRDQGLFFMVGEFVHGPDLGRMLRRVEERDTFLPPAYSAHIAAQVCQGLHAAHEIRDKDGNPLKLIHRDVSPNNVLISYDGFVKLIDFGVAWAKDKLAHTESGALKGKIGYISPEQILGHEVDRRSDIFSVGVLLYTMTTLSHPFPGKSDAERLNKIISGDIPMPSRVRPGVHPGLERIILKAMALSPDDRYDTAAQMAKELDAFIDSVGESVKPEDVSVLLSSLFAQEKDLHQSSLCAYRAARDKSSLQNSNDASGERLYEDSADASSGILPLSASRRKTPKRTFVFSITLAAVALIGVLFFVYWEKGDTDASVSVYGNADNSQKDMGAASKDKDALGVHDNSAEKKDNITATDPSLQDAKRPDNLRPVPPEAKSGTVESSGTKKKKNKHKKSGSDLLHSPYS